LHRQRKPRVLSLRGLRRALGLALAVPDVVIPSFAALPAFTATLAHAQHGALAVCMPLMALLWALLIRHRWYRAITPKTRLMIGVGVMAYAGAGLFLSDKAEEKFGLTPTEKDLEELKGVLPKITTVDRKDR
jgi:hypothetical protein